jgi:hypothetical protein
MSADEPLGFHAASLVAAEGRLASARAGGVVVAFLPYMRRSAAFVFCRHVEARTPRRAYVRHFFGNTADKAKWGNATRRQIRLRQRCIK